MSRLRHLIIIPIIIVMAGPVAANGTSSADAANAREIVKSFAETLKGRLVTALSEQGPVHAVDVCHVDAPGIAREHEAASGWTVARTSLKVRNPDNAPDAWERQVLESFAQRAAAGEDLAKMEHIETVERDGGKVLRYMKAIPMGEEPCMTCHGDNLQPELAAKIDELYPQDQARGFQPGELRGAFTLSRPLD
ncbi:MAG TPA: DUF3365 domain-containing protein [Arenicellales bacterium]|nr:DUF3365 domain-containing protein [Arenicellales bacterium]